MLHGQERETGMHIPTNFVKVKVKQFLRKGRKTRMLEDGIRVLFYQTLVEGKNSFRLKLLEIVFWIVKLNVVGIRGL